MIIECCVCKRIKQPDGSWQDQEVIGIVSHSYCPPCFEEEKKKLSLKQNTGKP